ncbi:phosphatidylinositol-specific phospholipase C [Streptomyces roseoverticillatus]|uniref:phosphatidylinositol-specific phospholipase C n=1 Tax=Streptomyces roseoverticillatus TaxID=66429 RepID=UPI0033D413EE
MSETPAEITENVVPEQFPELAENQEEVGVAGYGVEFPPPVEEPLLELPQELWSGEPAPADAGHVQPLTDWMAGVPNNVSLANMSIPGTHESAALHDTWSFGYATCQNWNLPQQLDAGVRFVDIRCRVVGSGSGRSFAVHHGDVYQKMMFGDALQQCWDFLQAHPQETILMRISQTKSNVSAEEFRWVFENSYKPWLYRFHIGTAIPTLGQVRGRIVLMTRDPYIGGLNLGSSTLFDTQDYWDRPTIAYKKQLLHNHLVKAVNAGSSRSKIFMNYTSANSGPQYGVTPWAYARDVNPYTLSELNRLYAPGRRVGVIATDFVHHPSGTALAAAVAKMNQSGRYPIVLTMTDGGAVSGQPYAGNTWQSFFPDIPLLFGLPGSIRGKYNNLALGLTRDGTVTVQHYTGSQEQTFQSIAPNSASLGLRNPHYDRALTMSSSGVVTGQPYTGGSSQRFRPVIQADGSFGIRNPHYWTA